MATDTPDYMGSNEPICGNCRYGEGGRCNRHAPSATGFPEVAPESGCGDWVQHEVSVKREFDAEIARRERLGLPKWCRDPTYVPPEPTRSFWKSLFA